MYINTYYRVPIPVYTPTLEEWRRMKDGEYGFNCSPDAEIRMPLEPDRLSEEVIEEFRLSEDLLTYAEFRAIVRFFKRECSKCNEDYLEALDFHHRDPLDKLFNVSQFYTLQNNLLPYGGLNAEALFDEIGKCDVLCANCHRKETFPRGDK